MKVDRVRHRDWVDTWVLWGSRLRVWKLNAGGFLCNIMRLRMCKLMGLGRAGKGRYTLTAGEMEEDTQ